MSDQRQTPSADGPGGGESRLLLLATEQQVHAFDLGHVTRVTIGRHESNDVQLSSRTVSNFHAEVLSENGNLVVRDLGSTNGTFVNDTRVSANPVAQGDRLRVGSHVMTVHLEPRKEGKPGFVRYDRGTSSFGPGTRGRLLSFRGRSADALKTLQVDGPDDLSILDLLKLLAARMEPAVAVLQRQQERARVFFCKQRVIHAEYGRAIGEKALYRLFGWHGASYAIDAIDNPSVVPRTIELPIDTLLMEGMEHAIELGRLVAALPPMEAPLRLNEDCPLPMTAHSPAEIEVFQAIIRCETIAKVLETSRLTDVRLLRLIDALLRKGVFEVAKSPDSVFQETFVGRAENFPASED